MRSLHLSNERGIALYTEAMAIESEAVGAVEKIIRASGHNLHTNVVEALKDAGYQVEISPYYVDAHTDKPREVDVVARKAVRVYRDSEEHVVNLVLALDCKYMMNPAVFWTFPNENPLASLKVLGLNLQELIQKVGMNRFAYFTTNKIARLFQSGSSSGEPVADPIYKACAQAISGTIFAREHSAEPAIIYPLVIADGPGKFFHADTPEEERSSVIVHIDYSYYPDRATDKKPVREPFYVWLIRKEQLSKALELIEHEVEGLRGYQEGILNEKRFNDRVRRSQVAQRSQRNSAR